MLDTKTAVVIAHVLDGTHFVLVTGYDTTNKNTFYVNDSAFATPTYAFPAIVGWRVFKMLG